MLDISNIDKIIVKDAYDTYEVKSYHASSIGAVDVTIFYPRRRFNTYDFLFYDTSNDREVHIEEIKYLVDFEVTLHIDDSGVTFDYRAIDLRIVEMLSPIYGVQIDENLLAEQMLESVNRSADALSGKEFFIDLVMKPIQMKAVID